MNRASRTPRRRLLELAALVLIAFNLIRVGQGFRGDWAWSVEDDVRQNMFVYARAQDPELFPDDIMATHALAFQPPGFRLIMSLVCRGIDVIVASKLVAILASVLDVILFAWVASLVFRRRSGMFWISLVFATGNAYMWFIALAGMPRSFTAPLSLLVLVAYLRPGRALYVTAAVLAALFSPTVLVVIGLLAPFKLYEDGLIEIRPRPRVALRKAVPFAIALGLCAGFVVLWQLPTKAVLGPIADYSEWKDDPVFQPGGRWPHDRVNTLREDLWNVREWSLPLGNAGRALAFVALLGAALVAVGLGREAGGPRESGPRKALRAFLFFFVAGLLARGLAVWLALRLYKPDRYFIPVVPAAVFGFFALLYLVHRLLSSRLKSSPTVARTVLAVSAAAFLLVAFVNGGYRRSDARPAMSIHIGPQERELLTFLRDELPRTAVVAGNPVLMDNVPIFSKRSVWTNYETILPVYPSFYRRMVDRTYALIPAYFTHDGEVVEEFHRETGVTHMVVSFEDLRPDGTPWTGPFIGGQVYIQPFTPLIEACTAGQGPDLPWFWESLESDAVVFRNAAFLVVDLRLL
jgi:hypothetical protein